MLRGENMQFSSAASISSYLLNCPSNLKKMVMFNLVKRLMFSTLKKWFRRSDIERAIALQILLPFLHTVLLSPLKI